MRGVGDVSYVSYVMNMLWGCGCDACNINTLCLERPIFAMFGRSESGVVCEKEVGQAPPSVLR